MNIKGFGQGPCGRGDSSPSERQRHLLFLEGEIETMRFILRGVNATFAAWHTLVESISRRRCETTGQLPVEGPTCGACISCDARSLLSPAALKDGGR